MEACAIAIVIVGLDEYAVTMDVREIVFTQVGRLEPIKVHILVSTIST